jgi:hypothetical protein
MSKSAAQPHPALSLKSRKIEPSGPEGFTLAELVKSQMPADSAAERSLEAHAELLRHKALLTRLEVGKATGDLIERTDYHGFYFSVLTYRFKSQH